MCDLSKTALILIGFQNDYFSPQGVLYDVVGYHQQLKLINEFEYVMLLK